MKNGILPVKLARQIFNIAVKNYNYQDIVVYDPFCGDGTILMEALRYGYDILGSDIQSKMVSNTIQNLQWICRKFNITKNIEDKIFQHDANKPIDINTNKKIVISTEGFLGHPKSTYTQYDQAIKELKNIAILYDNFVLHALKSKQIINIVLCFPAIKTRQGIVTIDKINPVFYNNKKYIKEQFLYKRDDQFVQRQVLIIENKT